jgi:hypothetical protein
MVDAPVSGSESYVRIKLAHNIIASAVLLGFALEEDVGEREAGSSEGEPVKSVHEYSRASEILVFPELIKQRVVEPVVITVVV